MSKIDVITKSLVIDLNKTVDSLIGFRELIPEGTEHDCFNLFVRSSLEKLEIDLKKIIDDISEVL